MDLIHERCGGIDIGKADLKACIRVLTAGKRRRKEVRTFVTTTNALLALRDWLTSEGITIVGMEAVLNARHMHNVPGRKTVRPATTRLQKTPRRRRPHHPRRQLAHTHQRRHPPRPRHVGAADPTHPTATPSFRKSPSCGETQDDRE
ncbi:hypothetical protein [Micromonospora violae]|uniref:hypothetical protein n=1 Tax=Micromonospora violae TaxID=1278207 RepID=UPI001ABFA7E6|nr:hypothetical protein [Micromonospora violae]